MTNRNVNEFTRIVHELKDEIFKGKKDASKKNPIPYGMERVSSRAAAAAAFKGGTPADRDAVIKKDGLEKVMKMLRGGDGRNA
jgi:hypothetical protein